MSIVESIFQWKTLYILMLVFYVPACLGLIVIVLLQKGKGAGFAGAFGLGGGGADTVFGPRASKSLPQRLTYIMASIFMVLALFMSIVVGRVQQGQAPELAEVTDESAALQQRVEDVFGESPPSDAATPEPIINVEAPDAEAADTAAPTGDLEAPAAESTLETSGEAAAPEASTQPPAASGDGSPTEAPAPDTAGSS